MNWLKKTIKAAVKSVVKSIPSAIGLLVAKYPVILGATLVATVHFGWLPTITVVGFFSVKEAVSPEDPFDYL